MESKKVAQEDEKPKWVVMAKLRLRYVNPETGKDEVHPMAHFEKDENGKAIQNESKLIGGAQIFGTGRLGGPAVGIGFLSYTEMPNDVGGRMLQRMFQTDPLKKAQVELVKRPYVDTVEDIIDDIPEVTSAQWAQMSAGNKAIENKKRKKPGPKPRDKAA